MVDSRDSPDGPVKVVDRRRWAHGEAASADAAPRKPAYVEELERLLAEKDKALQERAAKYRQTADEFEQVRLRLRRDTDKEVERARRAVLADFLDVVDNLERALTAAHDAGSADAALARGVELVHDLLLAKLAAHGVTVITADGQPFDPRVHEAVSILPVSEPALDERVVGVVRTGYAVGNEVLRPAAVVIGRLA